MRLSSIVLLAALISPSIAMANICKAISSNHSEREQCRKNFEEAGMIESGNWMIAETEDENNKKKIFARNYPVRHPGAIKGQELNAFMQLECVSESVALLSIMADKPINKGFDPIISFDNGGKFQLSTPFNYSSPELGRGAFFVNNQEFVKEMLKRSFISIDVLTENTDVEEYTYILDSDGFLYNNLSCLN